MATERTGRRRKLVRRAIAIPLVLAGGFVGVRYGTGNVAEVAPGAYYRSAQLTASGISRLIRDRGIRTVVNLRGCNPETPWYRAERAATLAAGASQVDLAMASDLWLSRAQMRTLVDVLRQAERPVLIHCEWGAERTGLASALVELLRPGGSPDSARAQFGPYYLYLPTADGLVMRGHVDAYERWLVGKNWTHTPERFLAYADSGYVPGSPSREEWPYDPYPLVVVTRPGGVADAPATAVREPAARPR
jgi:protein tyrosine phosphatase (PTP) superfamily phosphohydrolase (DUF442 family)